VNETSIDDKIINLQKEKDHTSAKQRDRQRLNNLLQKLHPGEWYSHCIGNGCILNILEKKPSK
jgi:hypothetical protein